MNKVGTAERYKERGNERGEKRGSSGKEERMHQAWCVGVFLLMQSFRDGERKRGRVKKAMSE